jgi:hypothetical protein
MKRNVRLGAIAILLAIAAGPAYLAFDTFRVLAGGTLTRVIIFPTDFVGIAAVVEDPANGTELRTRGFWHRETIIPIPTSGILTVRNMQPFHTMARDRVILSDGTPIDGDGQYPSRFRHRGVPKEIEASLAKYKRNNILDCVALELAATPIFKNFIPKGDQQQ